MALQDWEATIIKFKKTGKEVTVDVTLSNTADESIPTFNLTFSVKNLKGAIKNWIEDFEQQEVMKAALPKESSVFDFNPAPTSDETKLIERNAYLAAKAKFMVMKSEVDSGILDINDSKIAANLSALELNVKSLYKDEYAGI